MDTNGRTQEYGSRRKRLPVGMRSRTGRDFSPASYTKGELNSRSHDQWFLYPFGLLVTFRLKDIVEVWTISLIKSKRRLKKSGIRISTIIGNDSQVYYSFILSKE